MLLGGDLKRGQVKAVALLLENSLVDFAGRSWRTTGAVERKAAAATKPRGRECECECEWSAVSWQVVHAYRGNYRGGIAAGQTGRYHGVCWCDSDARDFDLWLLVSVDAGGRATTAAAVACTRAYV